MNYYIQGNAANADKIKAAFEKLGCDTTGWKFNVEGGFYYTHDGRIDLACGKFLINLIKTHPDYKELELSVEPKFKVGDRVIYNGIVRTITFMDEVYYDFDGGVAGCRIELQDKLKPASNFKKGDLLVHNSEPTCRVLVVDVSEKYGYQLQDGGSRYHLSFTTIEKEYHLWTIADAKDGDVLARNWYEDGDSWEKIIIFKNYHAKGVKGLFKNPCVEGYGNTFKNGKLAFREEVPYYSKTWTDNLQPATAKQRDLLFRKMKENGYEWDTDKKELRKIQPHYNIANFKPFDKVLTRYTEGGNWNVNLFSYYIDDEDARVVARFRCMNSLWKQCIPFNEETKHLLGTTDMCPEEYINW